MHFWITCQMLLACDFTRSSMELKQPDRCLLESNEFLVGDQFKAMSLCQVSQIDNDHNSSISNNLAMVGSGFVVISIFLIRAFIFFRNSLSPRISSLKAMTQYNQCEHGAWLEYVYSNELLWQINNISVTYFNRKTIVSYSVKLEIVHCEFER